MRNFLSSAIGYRLLAIGTAVAAALLPLGSAVAAGLHLTWSGDPEVSHRVYVGQASRQYSTNWTVTSGTNSPIDLSKLAIGTNFLAVAALWVDAPGTNAIISEYSGEVTIIRRAPPVVKLSVSLQTSTNLTAWVDFAGTAIAMVSADQNFSFFQPGRMGIEVNTGDMPAVETAAEPAASAAQLPAPPSPQ